MYLFKSGSLMLETRVELGRFKYGNKATIV